MNTAPSDLHAPDRSGPRGQLFLMAGILFAVVIVIAIVAMARRGHILSVHNTLNVQTASGQITVTLRSEDDLLYVDVTRPDGSKTTDLIAGLTSPTARRLNVPYVSHAGSTTLYDDRIYFECGPRRLVYFFESGEFKWEDIP